MRTGDLCKRQVVCCKPDATLVEVARLMRKNHVGSVIVVDEGRKPLGIVTDRDIAIEVVASELDPAAMRVSEVMSERPVSIPEEEDAAWALKVMRERGVRRLPVTADDGRLVGILALDDMLATAANNLTDLVQVIGTGRVVESEVRGALV
jgi:Predicted signal-transduction protein containing cAMP-binding and CBS domains